jgi:hypothetical protein
MAINDPRSKASRNSSYSDSGGGHVTGPDMRTMQRTDTQLTAVSSVSAQARESWAARA